MGTAKNGAHSAVTTRHTLVFKVPAGVKKTLLTMRDTGADASQDQEGMHGDGSAAPYAIIQGDGTVEYGFSIARHEYNSAIVATAQGASLAIDELIFDWIQDSTVNGLPDDTVEVRGCKIGDDSHPTDSAGNMVEISGMALNKVVNGVLRFKEAK